MRPAVGFRLLSGVALLAVISLAGCSSTPKPAAAATKHHPAPYLRMAQTPTNVVALEVAMRRFEPSKRHQPVVWTVAASHIGEPRYYAELQTELEQQSVVLFEGVGGIPRKYSERPKDGIGSLQVNLAHALGLVFQLDAIDYDKPNFQNSDMSIEQISRALSSGSSDPAPEHQFQELISVMNGSSLFGMALNFGINLIGASPHLQAMTKLVFIETLGQLQGDLAQTKGLPAGLRSVVLTLIHDRNKVVLDDLQKLSTLRPRPKSVAIFYGAGHMDNLEQRLVDDLGYRPAGEKWLRAFSVDLKQAELTSADVSMVHTMVSWQMRQLNNSDGQ